MAKTKHIGLNLTEDDSTLFEDWQKSLDGNGSGDNKSNMQLIDEAFGALSKKLGIYELEVLSTEDSVWEEADGKWRVRIPQSTHKLTKIHRIFAEKKIGLDSYENMIYIYKRYLSGSVGVMVDYKIDMKIIIIGEF